MLGGLFAAGQSLTDSVQSAGVSIAFRFASASQSRPWAACLCGRWLHQTEWFSPCVPDRPHLSAIALDRYGGRKWRGVFWGVWGREGLGGVGKGFGFLGLAAGGCG